MKTEIVMIVDKSGSMGTLANDVIGGFNSFLDEQIKNEIDANISVLLFDDTHRWVETNVDINKAKKLNKENYVPSGMTALNDAIARAYHVLEAKNPQRAIMVIVTDGEENSSKETHPTAVKNMIVDMQKREWRVIYLAANQDAFKVGQTMGIDKKWIANTDASPVGTRALFSGASGMSLNYASNGAKGFAGDAQQAYTSAYSKGT